MAKQVTATGTVEEYLEAILNMASEGKKVFGVHLADRLQVSRPTVTATVKRMRRDGLISSKEGGGLELTRKGMMLAIGIVRRHRLAERLLTDFLRIPWYESHQEACRLEHAISDKVVERLWEVLGKPATCPHGNPVPIDGVLPPLRGVPLTDVDAGSTVQVERISEEANRNGKLMEYYDRAEVRPGTVVTVKDIADYAGTITILIGKKEFSLGTKAASLVWVSSRTTHLLKDQE